MDRHSSTQLKITSFLAPSSKRRKLNTQTKPIPTPVHSSRLQHTAPHHSDTTFNQVARVMHDVEQEKGRIKITQALTCLLIQVLTQTSDPQTNLTAVAYLLQGSLFPAYENKTIGIGWAAIIQVLRDALGIDVSSFTQEWQNLGDIALVVETLDKKKSNKRQSLLQFAKNQQLTAAYVFSKLRGLTDLKGVGALKKKKNVCNSLVIRARSSSIEELRYIVRILQQDVRIGIQERTILNALSNAFVLIFKEPSLVLCDEVGLAQKIKLLSRGEYKNELLEANIRIRSVFFCCPCLEKLVDLLLKSKGNWKDLRCVVEVGIPIMPMLGRVCKSVQDAFNLCKLQRFLCEIKYDGQRAQIHFSENQKVTVFTRNLRESFQWSELTQILLQGLPEKFSGSFVIDAEIIAVQSNNDSVTILPFQMLSRRPKTADQDTVPTGSTINIMVCIFDVMYINGETLMNCTFRSRRNILLQLFSEIPGKLCYAESSRELSSDNEDCERILTEFLEYSFTKGEGVMIKTLDEESEYVPAVRSNRWIKLKKDYLDTVGDSFDLIPIGGWYGNGRKAGWFSPILMGCFDPETKSISTLCKVMSGFSDEEYKEITHFYSDPEKQIASEESEVYHINTNLRPSVWFKPCEVWEIRGADLTLSPVHTAGNVLDESRSGISLRFPRFMRKRPDKTMTQATSDQEIVQLYNAQFYKNNSMKEIS